MEPTWFVLGDKLMWPLVGMSIATAQGNKLSTEDLRSLPVLAFCHHAGCLESSINANKSGKHSAAICLVRQSIEALTIGEIGLQDAGFAEPLLTAWKEGKKTQGELRKALEKNIWMKYGTGLWDEAWAEFYSNLSRSVQPYAHYTPELQGWQFSTIEYDGGTQFTAAYGLQTYDALQATRVTFFHMLLTWMLGRILLSHGKNEDILDRRNKIHHLGKALSESKLLFSRKDWSVQLAPHMLFKPGFDWHDT